MSNFAKASFLTTFVMVVVFLLLFKTTVVANDFIRFFGSFLLAFSLPIYILATLSTKPKRTMKKFLRNLLVANSLPVIFFLIAQPILAILPIVIILCAVLWIYSNSGAEPQVQKSWEERDRELMQKYDEQDRWR